MTAWIDWGLALAGGSIRLWVFLALTDRWLGQKKPGRTVYLQGLLGVWILTGLTGIFAVAEFSRAALETVWLFVCIRRSRKADQKLCLFFGVFYEIGIGLWQFLFGAVLGVLFHSGAFLIPKSLENRCALGLFDLGLLCLAWYAKRESKETEKSGYRLASAVSVAGLLTTVAVSGQSVIRIPEDQIFVWEIQSVILLMALLVYRMRRQYDAEREIARLKGEQAALLERDYTALNRIYETHAKLFHDFRNHMGVLRQQLAREDYKGAARYLEELYGPLQELTDRVWTGDGTVDYLINQKSAQAEEQGIVLELQVEYPGHAGIKSADLCAVLGNLLDNALEAAGGIAQPDKRWIRLTIRRIHQMVVIKVENPVSKAPVSEDGRLLSTKKEKGLHGWGLRSARAAAEKYDGTVQTVCEGEVFRAVATVSCSPVKTE